MTSYEYTPLSPDEIRLVVLQPGPTHDFSAPLRISIEHHHLTANVDGFEALSYARHDAGAQRRLQLQGNRYLKVTRELETALYHMRLETGLRALWVHALCVNHDDVREREAQFALVPRIFGAAGKTIVWVGEEADDAAMALEYLDSLDVRWLRVLADCVDSGTSADSLMELYDAFHQSLGFNSDQGGEEFDQVQIQRAIAAFMKRPWFREAWAVAEFVLASQVELQCGNLTCDWLFARSGVKLAFEEHKLTWHHVVGPDDRDSFFRAVQQTLMMQSLREVYRRGQMWCDSNFLNIMKRFRAAQTICPEDKVWAFLPLVHTGSSTLPLRITYGQSTQELYTAVATHFVERDLGWAVIAAATQSPRLAATFPSWVPDWTEPPSTTSFAESLSNFTGQPFKAGGPTNPGNDGQNFFVDDDSALHASGAITHEVSLINEHQTPPVPAAKNLSRIAAIWHDLNTVMDRWPYAKYITGESLESIRTAVFYAGQTAEPSLSNPAESVWDPLNDLECDIPIDPTHPDTRIMRDFAVAAADDPLQARTIARAVAGRKLAILSDSASGYWHVGLVPEAARDGDCICILRACSVPLVLRLTPNGNYRLVGDCYVYGVMEGELLGSLVWGDIVIE